MLYLSGLGAILSGYLSYQTLFQTLGCGQSLITCGGDPVRFFGIPQCVLGFVAFVAVFLVAGLLIKSSAPKKLLNIQFWLSLAGTLFAGGLSYYELWIKLPAPTVMPACVYGFFLFIGAGLAAWLARRAQPVQPSARLV